MDKLKELFKRLLKMEIGDEYEIFKEDGVELTQSLKLKRLLRSIEIELEHGWPTAEGLHIATKIIMNCSDLLSDILEDYNLEENERISHLLGEINHFLTSEAMFSNLRESFFNK